MGIRADRAAATRQKLLEAAREEFQRNGFAGGRIDAIAASAGVNKRLIYDHFTSKAGLFDAVLADNVERVAAAVPFTPGSLPDYAVALFDYWMQNSTSLRLFSWRNIELNATPASEDATYREMIRQVEAAGAAATAGLPADHLLALMFALLLAWAIPADVFQELGGQELAARRATIRTAIERLLRPVATPDTQADH
ncbi:DNA-binding transcriptional regulator, AcrR family [Nakamurella panacisegetis]|uniref:DNA-binding transcriptional regulator, AcrR family n=1 Tax=Nakamurella panacisegetis TaxID=1090615 RepID=A0A1H0QLR9_9ACTN|nr:TetR/AcrR family transcriptional regulator [Nakamurella panacisegetis]SDP18222.1 DNA-binding transcriptional regulator, AcrR family [Nakamurella panacisegetis]